MSTVGLQAIGNDSIWTRRKWCDVRRREEQLPSISHYSPLVTWRSLHQTLFVTLECNFKPTFQLPIRSVRSFAVATTIFGNFRQFHHLKSVIPSVSINRDSPHKSRLRHHNGFWQWRSVSACTFDLSAAFDTIDHSILIQCLHNNNSHHMKGTALCWFESYFHERYQEIMYAGITNYNGCTWYSTRIGSWHVTIYYVHCLHSVYHKWSSANVYLICWWHTRIISHTSRQNSGRQSIVEDCISHAHRWLTNNRLWLNLDKTEVMLCSSARRASTINQPSLTIGHLMISPSNVVCDLGVQLQANLSVADQVGKVVRSCYYNIWQLQTIQSSLIFYALRDAVTALILSRLDYCNALYLNAHMCELHRLQMLINTAACVVSGRSRFYHITDFVKDVLYWLLITQRVHFKVWTLVYKATRGLAPMFLSDLVVK